MIKLDEESTRHISMAKSISMPKDENIDEKKENNQDAPPRVI